MALPLNTFRVTEVRRTGWEGCKRVWGEGVCMALPLNTSVTEMFRKGRGRGVNTCGAGTSKVQGVTLEVFHVTKLLHTSFT